MYTFTNEELDLLKIFHDKGAKWASKDSYIGCDVEFWRMRPCTYHSYHSYHFGDEQRIQYMAGNRIFSTDSRLFPSIKNGDLIDLDCLLKEKDTFNILEPSYANIREILSCCCCDGTLSTLHTESADYYRGKYDGLAEVYKSIRKEENK